MAQKKITDKSGARYYPRFDSQYPSVTTIIEAVLRMKQVEIWRGRVGNMVADQKMKIGVEKGTRLHKASVFIGTDTPDIPMDLNETEKELIDLVEEWHNDYVLEVISAEEELYSDRYKFAGTVDKRVRMRGDKVKTTTIDIKTGKGIWPGHYLQTAAYQYMANDHRRIILHIDQVNMTVKGHELENHKADFNAFLCCRTMYEWLLTI